MKVKIKRIEKDIPLPEYKTAGAAGFDFVARKTLTILPKSFDYIPLNACIATPKGYMLLLAERSSTHKKGLSMINGVAIGDQDFCGNGDEYRAVLYNFTDKPVTIERGERIVQGVFVPILKHEWREVDDMGSKDRGGFGTTGKK